METPNIMAWWNAHFEEILNAAFNGVNKILNGKSWPKSLHGFRMVVAVLLEGYILSGQLH